MAITNVLLLQSNFTSNNTFIIQRSFPTKWSSNAHLTRIRYNVITASPQTRMKRFTTNHHKTIAAENSNEFRKVDMNEVLWRSEENVVKELQKPVISGVMMLLLGLIFCYDQQRHAMAASGGRMGGRSFSSSSSSGSSSRSSSSSSRSYSSPESSSSEKYSSPRSSSSSSYSSTRTSSPESSSTENYSSPRSSSSSLYSSTRTSSPESSSSKNYSSPGSSVSRSYSSSWTSSPESSSSEDYSTRVGSPVPSQKAKVSDVFFVVTFVSIIGLIAYLLTRSDSVQDTPKSSVIKLQVGLLGTARSLQKDLNRINETADTSSPQGLSYILQETTVALLRHSDYCISSYSSVDVKRSAMGSEERFNRLSIEERIKLDEETLVNVDNITKQTASSLRSNEACSEYIVVTIIVAAMGIHELPPIKSTAELNKALQKLASISSSNIMVRLHFLSSREGENHISLPHKRKMIVFRRKKCLKIIHCYDLCRTYS